MSLVAAEQQTCGRFLFFKDNKSVLQFVVATYVHGYIKPMQEIIFVNIAALTSSFLWKIISRNQSCSKGSVLGTVSSSSFMGVGYTWYTALYT